MSTSTLKAPQRSRTSPSTLRAPRRSRSDDQRPTSRSRRSVILTVLMALFALYSLLPLIWLFINASKTQTDLFSSFGLWFSGPFALFDNIAQVFAYDDGIYARWLGNTLLYVVLGAGGATLVSALGGYGLAKYNFPGKKIVFAIILGAVAIPGTALAVPTFLMFSEIGLTNTIWAIIIPSLVSPFGLYLVWVYAQEAIPTELMEAARVDGSGEIRTFFTISLRLLAPGVVTVLLFSIVSTWNNYFLPLIMLSEPTLYPLTIGLQQWNLQAVGVGASPIYNLVLTGALLAIVPIVIVFILLQGYWRSGLSTGSVKQ